MYDDTELRLVRRLLAAPPPAVEALDGLRAPPDPLVLTRPHPELHAVGLDSLASGTVAVLTLAGGRSTRMGGTFRGDLPIGPVTGRTLLELQGRRVATVRRRFAPGLRWLIMVSDPVHERVLAALRRAGWFGLPERDVLLFRQRSLPLFDNDLQPLRGPGGVLLRCPDGNGALLAALASASLLSTLGTWGIRDLFAFQYPNALENVCDPVLLGYHRLGGHDVTLKVATGARPGEQVGRMVCQDGRSFVVEYHFLPTGAAADNLPFYTGTGVWSVTFLRRCWERDQQPPYRVVAHSEPGFAKPLRKVEQVLHELLPYADSVGVTLGDRDVEYATVKRPNGPDSLAAARVMLTRRYRAWLDHAGARAAEPITRLEIGPEFALSAEDLAAALPGGFRYSDGLVLE